MELNYKEDIKNFISTLEQKYGFLPKWNHGNNPKKLYYNTPFIDNSELEAVIETFLFSSWLANGTKVQEFEDKFSKIVNNKYTVATNSGSSANFVMLAALKEYFKWKDYSEIIVSAVGFSTTYAAIIFNKLTPVFIDISLSDLNFDIDKIEEKITDKTKSILVSPVLGNPPDYDKIQELANKYNLQIITDGCDSLLSTWGNKQLNELSVATSCSFYVAHHIQTAHGGSVSTSIKDISVISRSLTRWGARCYCRALANLLPSGTCKNRFAPHLSTRPDLIVDDKYVYPRVGLNVQLIDMLAAMGIEQLKKLPKIHELRIKNKKGVENLIKKYLPEIQHPTVLEKAEPSWFGTPLILSNKNYKSLFVNYLENNGIQTRNYFCGNILSQDGYKDFGDWTQYPFANQVLERVIFIGCNPNWTDEHFEHLEFVLSSFKP